MLNIFEAVKLIMKRLEGKMLKIYFMNSGILTKVRMGKVGLKPISLI